MGLTQLIWIPMTQLSQTEFLSYLCARFLQLSSPQRKVPGLLNHSLYYLFDSLLCNCLCVATHLAVCLANRLCSVRFMAHLAAEIKRLLHFQLCHTVEMGLSEGLLITETDSKGHSGVIRVILAFPWSLS